MKKNDSTVVLPGWPLAKQRGESWGKWSWSGWCVFHEREGKQSRDNPIISISQKNMRKMELDQEKERLKQERHDWSETWFTASCTVLS